MNHGTIGAGTSIGKLLPHQHHTGFRQPRAGENLGGKCDLINAADPIRSDHYGFTIEFPDQLKRRKATAKGRQQASRALHQEPFAAPLGFVYSADCAPQTDRFPTVFRRQPWGHRFWVEEWIYEPFGQFVALDGAENLHIFPRSGAEGLHCERVDSVPPHLLEQQCRQHRLADTGIGSGDKDDVAAERPGSFHECKENVVDRCPGRRFEPVPFISIGTPAPGRHWAHYDAAGPPLCASGHQSPR